MRESRRNAHAKTLALSQAPGERRDETQRKRLVDPHRRTGATRSAHARRWCDDVRAGRGPSASSRVLTQARSLRCNCTRNPNAALRDWCEVDAGGAPNWAKAPGLHRGDRLGLVHILGIPAHVKTAGELVDQGMGDGRSSIERLLIQAAVEWASMLAGSPATGFTGPASSSNRTNVRPDRTTRSSAAAGGRRTVHPRCS